MTDVGGSARQVLTVLGYRAAWRTLALLPETVAQDLFAAIADVAWWRRGPGVRQLEANLAVVLTWRDGVPPTQRRLRRATRAGTRSYLRYWCDAFRLPSWDHDRLLRAVRVENDGPAREALSAGTGLIGALGHLGNWDHAGAWSGTAFAPVTTVAERLRPAQVFEAFLAYRERLGMRVLPLDKGAHITAELTTALRGGGFVPLLMDRDLGGRGIEVTWFGHTARMAPGPAALAISTGAALVPMAIRYERTPASTVARWGIVIRFGDPVPVPATGTTRQKVTVMTQAVADDLAITIARSPQDWHMLQAVFDGIDVRAGLRTSER